MIRVLLLGANGQLGSDILRVNKDPAIQITAWRRADIDITDKENLKKKLMAQPFDILINSTSYHNTEQVEANPTTAFQINAFSVKDMAAICQQKNARFFHISTDYVFSHSHHHKPLTEFCCPAPLNVYGATKLMGEALAQSVYDNVVIFRVASLFGIAGASGKGGNFVETMIRVGREKGMLRVISDQIMSPTSTSDIAKVILQAISQCIPAGIYHTVNTGKASWFEFAKQIIKQANIDAVVEPMPAAEYPSVAVRPSYSALDNQKLTGLIGAIPTWEDALDRYLHEKGYRSHAG